MDVKNHLISIRIDSGLYNKVKEESNFRSISISELFREKFTEHNSTLATLQRIEKNINRLLEEKNG